MFQDSILLQTYWRRPVATIALPIAVASGIASFADLYLPGPAEIDAIELTALTNPAKQAAEIAGRVQFAFASLMVCVASVAGIVFALRSFAGAHGDRAAWVLSVLMFLFSLGAMSINVSFCDAFRHPLHSLTCGDGLIGATQDLRAGQKLRYIAVDHVFADIGAPAALRSVQLLTAFTTLLGAAAVAILVLNFAQLSLPRNLKDSIGEFRRRRKDQQLTLVFGALILTLSVNSTRSLYHWPLGMLGDGDAEAYSGLIAVATGYWGLFFTAILVAAAAPAMLGLNRDVEAFAAGLDLHGGDRSAWMARTGLSLAPRQAVLAAVAAAAPILSSPALDLLSGLFA